MVSVINGRNNAEGGGIVPGGLAARIALRPPQLEP